MGYLIWMMQIFTNLVDNALTHTPAGGKVHLVVRPHGDQAVEVLVQDTGKGISLGPTSYPAFLNGLIRWSKSCTQDKASARSGI